MKYLQTGVNLMNKVIMINLVGVCSVYVDPKKEGELENATKFITQYIKIASNVEL